MKVNNYGSLWDKCKGIPSFTHHHHHHHHHHRRPHHHHHLLLKNQKTSLWVFPAPHSNIALIWLAFQTWFTLVKTGRYKTQPDWTHLPKGNRMGITISPNNDINNMIKSDIFSCLVYTFWSVAHKSFFLDSQSRILVQCSCPWLVFFRRQLTKPSILTTPVSY